MQDLFRGEQLLPVLCEMDFVLHLLEVYIDWAVHLNYLNQGLFDGLEV